MLTASVRFQEDSVLYMRKNPNTIRHSGCKEAKTALRLSLRCFMSSCEVSRELMGLIIFVDGFGLEQFSFQAGKKIIKLEACC